jgi:hypothetical protein
MKFIALLLAVLAVQANSQYNDYDNNNQGERRIMSS